MHRRTEYSLLILLSFFLIVFFVFKIYSGSIVGAADNPLPPPYLSGYAWSSNIGWISFRNISTEQIKYGVKLDSDGFLSGYAWSSNIGWISFGCGGSDGAGGVLCSEDSNIDDEYPPNAGNEGFRPTLDLSSTPPRLLGFARACSYFASGCSGAPAGPLSLGGWDGWISLNGKTAGNVDQYQVTLDSSNNFSKYAWGGGQDDIGGQNFSPQFPGWIDFGPIYGGVKMCATDAWSGTSCGASEVAFECSFTPNMLVPETPITWTVTPSVPSGSYKYLWTVTPSTDGTYTIGAGGLTSDKMVITYHNPGTGSWGTNVQVRDAVTNAVIAEGACPAGKVSYTVGDKGFYMKPVDPMTTQFIRSIRSVTVPDVNISVDQTFGGFTDNIPLVFKEIRNANNMVVGCIAGAADCPAGVALLVEPQFWDADPNVVISIVPNFTLVRSGGGTYSSAMLRLKLTKNQSSLQSLPSGSNYTVVLTAGDSSNYVVPVNIPLKINNPSGGVIEK